MQKFNDFNFSNLNSFSVNIRKWQIVRTLSDIIAFLKRLFVWSQNQNKLNYLVKIHQLRLVSLSYDVLCLVLTYLTFIELSLFKGSKKNWPIETSLTSLVYLFAIFPSKICNLIGKNAGFVVSELVVVSSEQDNNP